MNYNMKKEFLSGTTIYLRAIEVSDLNENYRGWFNDEQVCQFNSHHRFPYYKQNLEDYFQNVIKGKNNLVLAIIDKTSDKHIGNIALQNINLIDRSAELAVIIGDKDYWKRGIGKEACRLLLNHGFKSLNLGRIYCGTSKENVGMQELAKKLGFKKEGVARAAIFKNGKYFDVFNYGLLKDEYKK